MHEVIETGLGENTPWERALSNAQRLGVRKLGLGLGGGRHLGARHFRQPHNADAGICHEPLLVTLHPLEPFLRTTPAACKLPDTSFEVVSNMSNIVRIRNKATLPKLFEGAQ